MYAYKYIEHPMYVIYYNNNIYSNLICLALAPNLIVESVSFSCSLIAETVRIIIVFEFPPII